MGLQQRVEILKTLYRGADILILDEPTGVLTPQETEQLFEILKTLRAQGVTILLITHKLKEIMAVTDDVSVMRAGQMVAHRTPLRPNPTELANLMVGALSCLNWKNNLRKTGEALLLSKSLAIMMKDGAPRLKDINFDSPCWRDFGRGWRIR